MKLSESWLRDMVNPSLSTQELSDQLTMAGLEVDGVAPVSNLGAEVVVSALVKVDLHPDAAKLCVCHVDYGGGSLLKVVCGRFGCLFDLGFLLGWWAKGQLVFFFVDKC